MRSAVLIPVKAFHQAKGRLAGRLSPSERSLLARTTATTVVGASGRLPVAVVCDDEEVARWAETLGAQVLWSPRIGLNAAVTDGVSQLAADGFRHVIVAHGDLPLASGLDDLITPGEIILVPDFNDGGTNVLSLPARCGFVFSYGTGSFQRHQDEAVRVGVPATVRRLAHLGLDIDIPGDLDHPLVQEVLSSLRTNQANPA